VSQWNILVVGEGSREHAILWKLRQSARVGRLYCAPGNGGTPSLAETVSIAATDVAAIADWASSHLIDLVIVGPENPLALGLADRLQSLGVPVLGPTAGAARIESSKSWAKDVMRQAGVPTAAHSTFVDADQAWRYARDRTYPLVVKADGLAAGKGVVIAQTPEEARDAISAAMTGTAFGDAGRTLVVEEYLEGEEMSLLAFVDGPKVAPLAPARDHKRIGDGDVGPNTGGMGSIAPSRLVDRIGLAALTTQILEPVAATLEARGVTYRGVLYAGLILTPDGPKVIEFNCRLGDPETQVILPLLADDLAEVAYATATGELRSGPLAVHPGYRCAVVLASGGYPRAYRTGLPIEGIDRVDPATLVFHASTRQVHDSVVTAGGRVLTVVGQGNSLTEARAHAYANAEKIHFDGAYYRHDIGLREV